MKRNSASAVALGGVMAALALVVMCLGTMIPLATYVCPMLCAVLLMVVHSIVGNKMAWTWYGAVSLLSLLLSPDKEAAAVFVFLGYYPIVKPWIDTRRFAYLWKLILFNVSILAMYGILIFLFDMAYLMEEFREIGTVMTVITLVMGNVTLFMLDFLLSQISKRKRRG